VVLGPPLPLRFRNPPSRGRAQRALPAAGSGRCFGGCGGGLRLALQLAAKIGHLRFYLFKLVLIAYQRRL
jgi:hypothetical protein